MLAEHPFVAPMNPKWRHCTVASTNTEGPHSEEAVTTLMNHIAGVPCFDILMGSPVAGNSAVLLDSYDADGGFAALEAAAVAGLKQVCGDGKPGGGRAHMAIGYGIADGDSGVLNSKLRAGCDPSHAVWHVDEALIVQVTQHPVEGEYRWEELGRVLLAA